MELCYKVYVAEREMGKESRAYFNKEHAEKDINKNGGTISEMVVYEEYVENKYLLIESCMTRYKKNNRLDFGVSTSVVEEEYVNSIKYTGNGNDYENLRITTYIPYDEIINEEDIKVIISKSLTDSNSLYKRIDVLLKHEWSVDQINEAIGHWNYIKGE